MIQDWLSNNFQGVETPSWFHAFGGMVRTDASMNMLNHDYWYIRIDWTKTLVFCRRSQNYPSRRCWKWMKANLSTPRPSTVRPLASEDLLCVKELGIPAPTGAWHRTIINRTPVTGSIARFDCQTGMKPYILFGGDRNLLILFLTGIPFRK